MRFMQQENVFFRLFSCLFLAKKTQENVVFIRIKHFKDKIKRFAHKINFLCVFTFCFFTFFLLFFSTFFWGVKNANAQEKSLPKDKQQEQTLQQIQPLKQEFEKTEILLKNTKTEKQFFPKLKDIFNTKKNADNLDIFILHYEKWIKNATYQTKDWYLELLNDLCFLYKEKYGQNADLFLKKLNLITNIYENSQNYCQKAQIGGILAMAYSFDFEKNLSLILKKFAEAEKIAQKNNCVEALAVIYDNMAKDLYERTDQPVLALDYYHKAIETLENSGKNYEGRIADLQYHVAMLHYTAKNPIEALAYLKKVIDYQIKAKKEDRNAIQAINTSALCYEMNFEFENSLQKIQEGITLAQKIKDLVWIGIFKINASLVYIKQKKFKEAKQIAEEGIEIIKNQNAKLNMCSGLYYIALVEYNIKNFDGVLEKLQKMEAIFAEVKAELKNDNLFFQQSSTLQRGVSSRYALAYQEKNEYDKATKYWKIYYELHLKIDSSNRKKSLFFKEKNLALQKSMNQILKAEKKYEESTKTMYFIVAISCVVFGLLGIGIYTYRLRAKNLKLENHSQHQKNQVLEEELTLKEQAIKLNEQKNKQDIIQKEQELTAIALQLYQKNDLITQINTEIQELKENTPSEQAIVKEGLRNLQSTLKNNEHLNMDWETFEQHFQRVHPDFLPNLRRLYPQLTATDFRICIYYRLNLENKTIAKLLNITPQSLSISRNRLRKKMFLLPNADITQVLLDI